MIRAATLVLIPARPGFFDLDAVRATGESVCEAPDSMASPEMARLWSAVERSIAAINEANAAGAAARGEAA